MHIEILGAGCPKCETTESNVRAAVDSLGIDATVEKVTDQTTITERGVLQTPAVAVDGEVVVSGSVPPVGRLESILSG